MFERLRQPVFAKRPKAEPASAAAEESSGSDAATAAASVAGEASERSASPRRGRRGGRDGQRALVGLDIEPGLLVAVKSRAGSRLEVERAAYATIAPDVVRDGEVNDVAALAEALRELFKSSRLERRVRIGIANQRIMMRRLELPPLTDAGEIELAVRFQAQDEIPMPLESVVLDYRSLGITEGEDGARLNVLLVAARRDMVERVLQASRLAGLSPEGIDLAAFGMVRALQPRDASAGEEILYLSIGGLTNLAVSHDSTCEFTRVLASGIEQIASAVAGRCGVSLVQATDLLRTVGAEPPRPSTPPSPPPAPALDQIAPPEGEAVAEPSSSDPAGVEEPAEPAADSPPAAPESGVVFGRDLRTGLDLPRPALDLDPAFTAPLEPDPLEPGPLEPFSADTAPGEPEQADLVRAELAEGIRRIAAEVRNSLDFYQSAHGAQAVTRAVICGPALDIAGFEDALSRELGIPVARGEVALASPSAAGRVPLSLLAVAAGLSVVEAPR